MAYTKLNNGYDSLFMPKILAKGYLKQTIVEKTANDI